MRRRSASMLLGDLRLLERLHVLDLLDKVSLFVVELFVVRTLSVELGKEIDKLVLVAE